MCDAAWYHYRLFGSIFSKVVGLQIVEHTIKAFLLLSPVHSATLLLSTACNAVTDPSQPTVDLPTLFEDVCLFVFDEGLCDPAHKVFRGSTTLLLVKSSVCHRSTSNVRVEGEWLA